MLRILYSLVKSGIPDTNEWCVHIRSFLYELRNEFGRNRYCNPHNANQTEYSKLHTFVLVCYSRSTYSVASKFLVTFRANDSTCFIH
jgi:hypothetical protein